MLLLAAEGSPTDLFSSVSRALGAAASRRGLGSSASACALRGFRVWGLGQV